LTLARAEARCSDMSEGYEIDLDGEQVLFDGTWYSKEELARKIKTMVDAGDYRVARPSSALESLQNALSNLRTLSVRLPTELAEALATNAARNGQPVGAYVRDALARSLPQRSGTPLPMPIASSPSSPSAPPMLMPVTEPARADEVAGAIPLTPKRR
jgi:hypothetical protein